MLPKKDIFKLYIARLLLLLKFCPFCYNNITLAYNPEEILKQNNLLLIWSWLLSERLFDLTFFRQTAMTIIHIF